MSKFGNNRGANVWGSYSPVEAPHAPGKRRTIPREQLRKMAMASTEGGTAKCHYCKHTFSVTYAKLCWIDSFTQDYACYDCRIEKGLKRVL